MYFPLLCLSVYGFNVVTQLWSDLPRFTKDRGYHGIASFGGQLYVTGGYCNINSETLDIGNKKYFLKTDKHDKSYYLLELFGNWAKGSSFLALWINPVNRERSQVLHCPSFLQRTYTKSYFTKCFHFKGR